MKNIKIVYGIVWIIITVAYIWNLTDIGRSMGAQANSAVENYVEYYTEEYIGVEGVTGAATNAWHYANFNNLTESYQSGLIGVGVTTVIYIVITIACYHFSFIHKAREKR